MQSKPLRWAVGGGLIAGAIAAVFVLRASHSDDAVEPRAKVGEPTRNPSGDSDSNPASRPSEPTSKPAPKTTLLPAPAVAPAPSRGETVVRAPWGGASGELGRKAANESSPEGPMSFEVDERGRAFVLDQVNSRVEVFEPGKAARSIPVPSDTFQDLALAKNDSIVLLDRLTTGSIAYVDAKGKVTHEIALAGKGIEEGGDVTALTSRSDGVWVEVKHANLVRVADADGNPLEDRDVAQGRFAADGVSVLRASKSGSSAAFVSLKSPDKPVTALARVQFEMPLWQILGLETDHSGRIVLGVSLVEEAQTPPYDVTRNAEVVVVLGANGAELNRFELPANAGPEESFRRLRLGADGMLYHLAFDEQGATLTKVQL